MYLQSIPADEPPVSEPVEDSYHWVSLNGPWTATWYGDDTDDYINKHHGAYYNGLSCEDANNPGNPMPDHVTGFHHGVALPGPEFYCVPVKICRTDMAESRCIVATSVDVMRDYRLRKPGSELYYSHLDLWPEPARQLGLLDEGIHWGDLEVHIGVWK